MATNNLPPELLEQLAALAQNPREGETFTIAKREFTRQFLSIDGEEALTRLVIRLIKDAKEQGLGLVELFESARAELREAAALIIADWSGTEQADELAWIRKTRGVTTAKLLELVIAQVHLQELGMMLGKLLMASGLLNALLGSAQMPRPTSAE